MNYPGNTSLGAEIQRKILDTYGQSLDLAAAGKREEALLGCDFSLRLDPLFEPARTLQERIEGQTGAVPVDDLASELAALLTASPAMPSAVKDEEPAPAVPRQEQESGGTDTGIPAGRAETPVAPALDEQSPEFLMDQVDTLDEAQDLLEEASAEPAAPVMPQSEEEQAAFLESALDLDSLADDGIEGPAESDDGSAAAGEPAPAVEPTAALDKESEERIEELLADGQKAFHNGEYQSAIDAWSRIFLIDIEHPEANRRIELARKLKAEVERKLEEKYHDALSKLERGDLEEARIAFGQVLELQPGHVSAREYMDRLSAGEFTRGDDEDLEAAEEVPDLDLPELAPESYEEEEPFEGELDYPTEMFEPAAEVEEPALAAKPRPTSSRRPFFVIAGIVLAVVVVGAWLLYDNWDRAFPNAEEQAQQQPVARVDPIDRATALYVEGQAAIAIAQLRRLPPAHPQYDQAQALIAQWEAAAEEGPDDSLPEEVLAERDRLVALAREAFANRDFLVAEELFDLARHNAPLDDGTEALAAETSERLAPIRSEIEIFRQGEWAYALRSLWAKHEEDPGNPDMVRLMVDAYYNLAVRDLQRGDSAAALDNLEEALALDPDDKELNRLFDFTQTYRQRDQDLLYRIFVKYLPFR